MLEMYKDKVELLEETNGLKCNEIDLLKTEIEDLKKKLSDQEDKYQEDKIEG
jgi:hypothetical protein